MECSDFSAAPLRISASSALKGALTQRTQRYAEGRREIHNAMMLIIPAIDLKNGRCVRLLQGRKSDVTVYNENPIEVAKEFASAGAQMIHVVDLDGAFSEADSPNRAVVQKILEAVDVPIEFGGGIRSLDDIYRLEEAGCRGAIVGKAIYEGLITLKDLASVS